MPIIVGGQGAEEVAQELKAAGARVVVSVNYPTRPKELAPDADESLEVLQARAAGAARRWGAGRCRRAVWLRVGGVEGPEGVCRQRACRVRTWPSTRRGHSRPDARRARRWPAPAPDLDSIERGKRANLLVTEGDLLDAKPKIKHVFVGGRLIAIRQ